jgi:hypothetical protein
MSRTISYSQALLGGLPDGEKKTTLNDNVTVEHSSGIKHTIAKILNVPMNDSWEIIDQDEESGLYLVHYHNESDMMIYGNLRGIIVDVPNGIIVQRGRGYTPVVQTDEIKQRGDGGFEFKDIKEYSHKVNNYILEYGFEGTSIYRWVHNGIVRFSTHRNINARNRNWSTMKTFGEIYDELGGPSDEFLFHKDTKYSSIVYEFIIIHPDLLHVTKLPVGTGFIAYVGMKRIWKDGAVFGGLYDPVRDDTPKEITGSNKVPVKTDKPVIHLLENISLEAANRHLTYGFYKEQDFSKIDARLGSGEFVVLYSLNENKEVEKIIKIESTAYSWRSSVRTQNPSIKHRFYELLSQSYFSKTENLTEIYDSFIELFPVVTQRSINELNQLCNDDALIIYPQEEDYTKKRHMEMLKTREQRFYNIFISLLISVPLHLQHTVLEMFPQFQKDRNSVIHWIIKLHYDRIDLRSDPIYKRVQNIDSVAWRQAEQTFRYERNGLTVDSMYKHNVQSLIMKERGDSLYRLVKLMYEKCPPVKKERAVDNL